MRTPLVRFGVVSGHCHAANCRYNAGGKGELPRDDMMRISALGILVLGCMLVGCGQQGAASGSGPNSQGRYAGIGTFDAGELWSQMAGLEAPADTAAAKVEDDEHIIVVIDSHTGEVKQCGDHSGVCVTMNPWAGQGPPNAVPIKLKKHASDLAAEDGSGSEESAQVTNSAAPTR